ncbi:MFS transporter [Sphingomonas sp. MG17]|uniref:MFS transporter n=1 Tax=Sphingomonas tagetis TaxID=2949092 RepID=A0A9X2HFS2_9SPHN|nr:MFS transporter [Sphingomonas tagetis]MCP3730306.1 MFS transporter [Sphingomonas tagetis]
MKSANWTVLPLCYFAGLVDGYDIIMNGLAAPQLAVDFGISPDQMGRLFALSSLGLLLGSLGGGWCADRFGPKRTLIGSLLLFGSLSYFSSRADSVPALMITRMLTGVGIGALFPALLAIVVAVSPPASAARRATAMVSAVTMGSAFAAFTVILQPEIGWRTLFLAGGLAPLALVPLIAFLMPHIPFGKSDERPSLVSLLRHGRAANTLILWLALFCMIMVGYILINWLPTLLADMTYAKQDIGVIILWFTFASSFGVLFFAYVMREGRMKRVMAFGYAGAALGIVLVASIKGHVVAIAAAAAMLSFCQTGVQCFLYGLSPTLYPAGLRGTGSGAAVGAGRVGAIVGPLAAGQLLALGLSPAGLLFATLPIGGVSLLATLALLRRRARLVDLS